MRLPRCPYCKKQLDYKNAFRAKNSPDKQYKCRRCGKLSSVRHRAANAKTAAIFGAAAIALNTLMFFKASSKTLLPNLIVTLVFIIVYLVLTPLNVTLHEIASQKEPEPKLKKNRHRHKKTKNEDIKFNEEPLKGNSFDN